MKTQIIYLSLTVLLLLLGMFFWLRQSELSLETVKDIGNDFKRDTLLDKMYADGELPPLPSGWTIDDLQQKMAEDYAERDAKLYAEIEAEWEQQFPEWRKNYIEKEYPITEDNREEIEQMLAKFHPIVEKSDTEIIQILMSFYPEDEREVADAYLKLFQDFSESHSPLEKEQNVFILVHTAQMDLAGMREAREEVEKDWKFKQRDPDAYYTTKIQETEAEIPETEELIRDAEERDDLESVEAHRSHLTYLHERIKILNREQHRKQNWDVERQAMVQQQLEEWEKDPPEWLKPYQRAKADTDKLLAELKNMMSVGSERTVHVVPSESPSESPVSPPESVDSTSNAAEVLEPSQVHPVSSYDPVKSLTSAYVSFRPFRVDLDEKYFDVVVSQYMTPAEFDKFFPTQADRDALKLRTSQLRKSVVSKVREVVSGVKGATPAQKRQLARELVTANYEKSFAESVLKALEQDIEE